ncbi:MAG: sensor histidine kinase [Rubrivivax sp.]
MMAPPNPVADVAANVDEIHIRRELLAAMLAQTRTAVAGNLAIGLTTAAVLVGSGVSTGVGGWLAVLLALVGLRAVHARGLKPRCATLDRAGLARAEHQLTGLLAASGLTWGVLPWLSYTGRDPFVDFFCIAMLVGMTAGAVNSTAALPRALNLYILGAFLPFVAKSAFIGGLVYGAGGVTIVFSTLVLMAFGRSSHRAMRGTLVATQQNARLAEALRKERDAVQATLRAKNLFLAGVTHDLRQPVHAMALHLRYLRSLRADQLQPETVASLCEPMDGAMRAMSSQLTRLLELSRLEAGEVQPARRAVSLAQLLDVVSTQFDAQAAEKGLRLRLRPMAVSVDSDPRMLQSIVDNLVANAVRYTRRGGVLVAARQRGANALLTVIDTGPGIEKALLPELFIAYRRFDDRDRGSTAEDGGQGLGLALVRKQVDLLGHGLKVRSVPGRGSAFTLRLAVA